MTTTQNKMNWKEKAEVIYKEQVEEVKYYIKEGIEKSKALKMVLDQSTLGVSYKAQLKHEFNLDYEIKCHTCKTTLGYTNDLKESVAGKMNCSNCN